MVWQNVMRASLVPALLAGFIIWSMMRSVPGDVPGTASTRAYFGSVAALLKKPMNSALVLVTGLRSMGKVVLVPAMIIMGLLFFALRFADTGLELIVVVAAMGAFLYSMHTIFIAAAMDVAGGEVQSTVVSLIYGAGFIGTASPIFAGIIADATNETSNAFLYGGVVILLAAVILLVLRLPRTAGQMAEATSH